jgi:outer membrane protein assembly factor BamA
MKLKRAVLFLPLFMIASAVCAQVIPPERSEDGHVISADRIGSFYSVLPLAGYTSDLGLFGGGFIQRINYGIDVRPFLSTMKTDFTISTKGNIVSKMEYERTRLFGRDIRSRVDFIGQRIRRDYYFGIGNDTEFSEDLLDGGYFYFDNRELYLNYQARRLIREYGTNGKLDFFGSFTLSRANGLTQGEATRFEEEMPPGFGKNWVNKIGFGLIADSRDHEFSPGSGIRYEFGFNTSSSIFGSDYSYSDVRAELRHFAGLLNNVVLAHRFEVRHNLGEAPFWALPVIGNQFGLRGYHRNRFRGDSSVLNMTELRTWLFSVFDGGVRIGAQAFWDTGRVFSDADSNSIFDDWHHTFGFGGAITLFNPDFIVRGDVGFSDETMRIYFGAGYIF